MKGLTVDNLKHMLGVARKCYSMALYKGFTETEARQLFIMGLLHDAGKEFTDDNDEQGKALKASLEDLFDYNIFTSEMIEAIELHGKPEQNQNNNLLKILNEAELSVNDLGMNCEVYNRLIGIENRYGTDSKEYRDALKLAKELNLVNADYGKEPEAVETNSNGVNVNIKANILDDVKMREIGFTEHRKGYLYFSRLLKISCKNVEITFNVTIPRDGSDIRIDILDEAFCQPYDYQHILHKNPNSEFALLVREQVEYWMKYLMDAGVLEGHKYGEYI